MTVAISQGSSQAAHPLVRLGRAIADPFRRLFDHSSLAAELIASEVDRRHAQALDPAEIARLDAGVRPRDRLDQLAQAIAVRLILGEHMSKDELVRYLEHLQNRYLAVVGPGTFAKYAAGAPKIRETDKDRLLAELHTLSYRLRLAYSITELRDRKLAGIRSACAVALCLALGGMAAITLLANIAGAPFPLHFVSVGIVGAAGAATSIARRADRIVLANPLEDDPIVQASALDQSAASLLVAGLCGPIFALILLLLFMIGFINAPGVTPNFVFKPPTGLPSPDFTLFGRQIWMASPMDGARIYLWSFIAGFAEQLVPDVLDRFGKTAEGKKKKHDH